MDTEFEFSNLAVTNCLSKYGNIIEPNEEQKNKLKKSGKTSFSVEQLSNAVETLCPTNKDLLDFITTKQNEIGPISLSLFVLNNELWKMMQKKERYQDKMLPMITFPWFYWESEAVDYTNPSGTVSHPISDIEFSFSKNEQELHVTGKGGNFCGLMEGKVVDRDSDARPIIIPSIPSRRTIAPNYESTRIKITFSLPQKSSIYETPLKMLDYMFSESPKVFYTHGLTIRSDGSTITLRTAQRHATQLKGEVITLVGCPLGDDDENSIEAHLWIHALARAIYRNERERDV